MGPVTTAVPESALSMHGSVFGGQQPISGASIRLYRASKSGYRGQATNILTQAVTTDSQGFFTLTNLYSCGAADDQMYAVAYQGNPGLGVGANNPAIAQVAALGNCGNLSTSTYITINEVTTAAAAWALAQFSSDFSHVGTSATNVQGLKNAFLDVQLLADTSTGLAQTALLSTQVVEQGKLYALADALASCVNSTGTGVCDSLFAAATPPGGATPTDTFTAALNIVKNPGSHVADVFNLINSQPPFPTTLTAAPNDWTMSMTVSGGGLAAPTALQVDQLGNVWVAGYYGVLAAYTPQGVPFSGSGFGLGGYLSEVYGLAIDSQGNPWLTDEEIPNHSPTKGGLIKFQGSYTPTSNALGTVTKIVGDASLNYPESIAADPVGYVDAANYASGSASVFALDGSLVASNLGKTQAAFPVSIIPDVNHGVWLANQESATISHDLINGSNPTSVSCCGGPNGVALDSDGAVWATNYWSSSVSQVSAAGAVLINQLAVGGVASPAGLAVDGAQNVWTANYHGASISGIYGTHATQAVGTPISPTGDPNNGVPGGFGLDANLVEPFSLAPDNSGNLWVANHANDDVVMFFGLAAPTTTPTTPVPALP